MQCRYGPAEIREYCILPAEGQSPIRSAMRQMHFSARGYCRVLEVSPTIADLEDVAVIQTHHRAEALPYRTRVLDLWGPGGSIARDVHQ
ncbi:MAG: hypothetical protein MUQ10_09195 [Anaerolineae bacterium]|nr:hypothetical protein [Anaerolineae bacterium]